MKIILVTDKFLPEQTTVGKIVYNLAQSLLKNGHAVSIITTTQERDKAGEVAYAGMRIFKIYSNYRERWRAYLSLYNSQTTGKFKAIVDEIKPDIIHAHNIHYQLSYRCLKIAKQSGAKVFLTAHDAMLFHYGKLIEFIDTKDFSVPEKFNYQISARWQIKRFKWRYNPFRNFIIHHYLKYVDKIFAVSDALKEALKQNGIQKIDTIYNGIDVNAWSVDQEKTRAFKDRYQLKDKKIVLFGGRLSEAKGGRQLILAMRAVFKKIPEAILLIIGEKNQYASEMLREAKASGIAEKLIFTGWLSGDELKASYQVSDLLIMPSICLDTFGMVCLEAMACKKPVVATCFGGAKEVVVDGQTGYIVNPLNTNSMVEKTFDLLENSQKAEQFGLAGYERVKTRFSLDIQVNKTVAWYGLTSF